ncbi:MAG: SCO family protein [Sphingopyxis sp.]|nr:SCO family protein [Sphingopyxis sp.]
MMNSRNFPRYAMAALAAALLSACNPAAAPEPYPLAGAQIGGSFTLTNQDGQTVRDSDFAGKYRLVYFGYSYCPDVCPVDLQNLMLGFKQFERSNPALAARVQPLFITVDPERDTPAQIKNFVAQFHPRLIGLTGTPQQIADVAAKYLIQYRRTEGSRPDAYLVGHTQLAFLMGPEGQPLAFIPHDDVNTPNVNEGTPDKVAAELTRWVR